MPWLKRGVAANRLTRNPSLLQRAKRRPALLFVSLFAVLCGVVLLNASSAETRPVSLYLTPDTETVSPNSEFALQLRVDSGPLSINAVQADIAYPAQYVQLLGVEAGGSRFTTEGPGGGSAGTVLISRGAEGNVSGDQPVAKLRFKSLSESSPAALITFRDKTYVYDAAGERDVLGGQQAARGATLRIDGEGPVVALKTPTAESAVRAGSTVPVIFEATDEISEVSRVEFYVNSVKVGATDKPPYEFKWNTKGYTAGSRHTLHAQAVDNRGNVGASHTLTIMLAR